MGYNEKLAMSIRECLPARGITEKKMFGGIAFFLHGNMVLGTSGEEVHVRVGKEAWEKSLKLKGARPFDLTGRVMKTYVTVDPPGYKTKAQLKRWVEKGLAHAKSLPRK